MGYPRQGVGQPVYDLLGSKVRDDILLTEPLDNSGGRLKLPAKAGLGIEMNMEFLRGNVVHGFGGP